MKPDKTGCYAFVKNRDVQPLLRAEIRGLVNLQNRLANTTAVAFDIEGVTQHFEGRYVFSAESSELGVAVLRPGAKPLQYIPHMLAFYEQNDIEAFTIRTSKRPHGPVVGTMTDETKQTAGARLFKFLSSIQGERMLLGFGMEKEFKWISEDCPSIAGLFTSWCDVQELIADGYRIVASEPDKLAHRYLKPGLDGTMKALRISGWRGTDQKHGAAADSVKFLAVLAGLLSGATLHELPKPKTRTSVRRFRRLPSLKLEGRTKYHNARISASDGGKLPLQTPDGLASLYAPYQGLSGVGLNSQSISRVWWVSFSSKEMLDKFIVSIDRSIYEEVELRVTRMVSPKTYPVTETSNAASKRPPTSTGSYYNDLAAAFEILSTIGESRDETQTGQQALTMTT